MNKLQKANPEVVIKEAGENLTDAEKAILKDAIVATQKVLNNPKLAAASKAWGIGCGGNLACC